MSEGFKKRRYPRRRFVHRIGVLKNGQYSVGQSVEIGEGGMRVEAGIDVKIGDILVLSFLVTGGSYIVVKSEIRFVKESTGGGYDFGVAFLNLDFTKKRVIRDYIAAKTEMEARSELEMLSKEV